MRSRYASPLEQQRIKMLASQRASPTVNVMSRERHGRDQNRVPREQSDLPDLRSSKLSERCGNAQPSEQGKVRCGKKLSTNFFSRKLSFFDQRNGPSRLREQQRRR